MHVIAGKGDIRLNDNRSISLNVDGAPLKAGKVVLATGSWSQPLLEQLGVAMSVQPVRGQIVHLQLADKATRPAAGDQYVRGRYFLGFPDGRVVVGGTHEPEAGFEVRVTAGGVHSVLDKTLAHRAGARCGHAARNARRPQAAVVATATRSSGGRAARPMR